VGSLALILGSGVAAGAIHVVSGADHLAALLPLSVGQRGRAFGLGVRWGIGHSAGVLVIGALAVALRHWIDIAAVEVWGERLVGVMLIALGVLGIRRALRFEVHAHSHLHDGLPHTHLHVHGSGVHLTEPAGPSPTHQHSHTAFFAGTLHGVAGTAHVLGVLPALGLPDARAGALYLVAFAAGTVGAMGTFAMAIGEGSARAAHRGPGVLRGLMYAAGAAAIAVGVCWLVLPALGYGLPEIG
jgi:hypothetical protein